MACPPTKAKSREDCAETITDRHDTGDLLLLQNASAQDESLHHSLEHLAGGIGFSVKEKNPDYTCFKQEGTISILNDRPLKFVGKFTYIGSNISSPESDVNLHLGWLEL